MSTLPFRAPRRPAALAALPSNRELALYDESTRTVHTYACCGGQLVETGAFSAQDVQGKTQEPGAFFEWRMAANAPLVVGLDEEAGLWILKPQRVPRRMFSDLKVTRLAALDRLGLWAVVQCRRELVLLDLANHRPAARWLGSAADVQVCCHGRRHLAHMEGDSTRTLVVQREAFGSTQKARARLVPPAGAGVPLHVHFSGDVETNTLYVIYEALRGEESARRLTLQKWQVQWGERCALSATHAVHFADAFDDFTTLPGTAQRACAWPKRGGYVLESWRDGVPFTSRVRPVGTRHTTLWVPHDMPDTIHATATGV
jgi:hypothetical protein